MHPKFASLLFLLAVSVRSEPAFVGVLSDQTRGTTYAVIPNAGTAPQWVKVGDTVDGYTVSEYQANDEVLVLKKDAQVLRLPLKTARTADAPMAEPPVTAEQLAAAKKKMAESQERLKKLREERDRIMAERAMGKK